MHIYILVRQRVRHSVEVTVDFDVIVEVDTRHLPFAKLVTRSQQRLQCRLIQFLKQNASAPVALAERPLVRFRLP